MQFLLISILAIALLGIAAAVASCFDKGSDEIVVGQHDCASCTAADDGSCKLHCLMEEKKQQEGNKTAP